MSQLILPIQPEEATKNILKTLQSKRMKDVLEKRFGLRGGRKRTLESIGQEYKITRERVRQIENDAMRHLAKSVGQGEANLVFDTLKNHLNAHGGVMAEWHLFGMLAGARQAPHVAFILSVGRDFSSLPETAYFFKRWTVDLKSAPRSEDIMNGVTEELEKISHPVSREELCSLVGRRASLSGVESATNEFCDAYLASSRLIKQNPYGEYGLVSWPTIHPRGVKDKAYLVLLRSGKPMHFREVAASINQISWQKKKAHPQTVHNELIKDSRFVLVGRGLYALGEWGYESGTVRDVLVSVFKEAGKPLLRDEILKLISDKRIVKPPTVMLNLQNKSYFKRLDGGKYTLV